MCTLQRVIPITAIGVKRDDAKILLICLNDSNRVGLGAHLNPSSAAKYAALVISPLMIDVDTTSLFARDSRTGVARIAESHGVAGRRTPVMGVFLIASPPIVLACGTVRRKLNRSANSHLLRTADAHQRNAIGGRLHSAEHLVGDFFLSGLFAFGASLGLFALGGFLRTLGHALFGAFLGFFFSCFLGALFGCGLFLGCFFFVLHDLGGHVNFKPVSHIGGGHHVGVAGLFGQLDFGAVAFRLDRIKRVAVCCDGLELEFLLGVNLDTGRAAGDVFVVVALDDQRRVVQLQLNGCVSGRGLLGLVLVLRGLGCLGGFGARRALVARGCCVVLGFLRGSGIRRGFGLRCGLGLGLDNLLGCRLSGLRLLRCGLGGFCRLLRRVGRRRVSGRLGGAAVVDRLLVWSCGIALLACGECGYVDQRRSQEDGYEHGQGLADKRILKFD